MLVLICLPCLLFINFPTALFPSSQISALKCGINAHINICLHAWVYVQKICFQIRLLYNVESHNYSKCNKTELLWTTCMHCAQTHTHTHRCTLCGWEGPCVSPPFTGLVCYELSPRWGVFICWFVPRVPVCGGEILHAAQRAALRIYSHSLLWFKAG